MVSTAAFHARVRGSVPGLGGLKETKLFLPHPRVKVSIVGSLRDREVACSASDRQGSNFESCVWRTVSSQSSHHPQEVLLAQFSLYVHKGGLKPDSFHFFQYRLVHLHLRNVWFNDYRTLAKLIDRFYLINGTKIAHKSMELEWEVRNKNPRWSLVIKQNLNKYSSFCVAHKRNSIQKRHNVTNIILNFAVCRNKKSK